MPGLTPQELDKLSPFELKDLLIQAAKKSSDASAAMMLNAGRGNPNWIATTPREAFFLLGRFALSEARLDRDEPGVGLAGMPQPKGIGGRFERFLKDHASDPGADLLRRTFDLGVKDFGFDADAFAHELADAMIGDNYPVPDRFLVHAERITRAYLDKTMFDGRPPAGSFDLFAVEGGTAAMCYIFDALKANRLLNAGDTIAIGSPIFTPYIEMPGLEDYQLKLVNVDQNSLAEDGSHSWQYEEDQIKKLEDPAVKAFFIANPSNPPSYAIRQETIDRLVELVRTKRPDLMILTDDVYGTFVPGFRSLAAELPHNTILVYSYSKHFGATGWRLGVIGVHEDNIYDGLIAKHPPDITAALTTRYGSLTTEPEKMKFIDRIVADSRRVALNHTAGLSLPQQMQMLLFSSFAILDKNDAYQERCREIVRTRMKRLFNGLDYPLRDDPTRADYYCQLDLENWAARTVGQDFVDHVNKSSNPYNLFFRLAEEYQTVLLNGSGFDGPPWAVRVSLANLDDDAYEQIGKDLAEICRGAAEKWRQGQK
jgi:aspartate 4-decarboxylase